MGQRRRVGLKLYYHMMTGRLVVTILPQTFQADRVFLCAAPSRRDGRLHISDFKQRHP